jgi:large subunit ribosomal protein L17
MRHRIHGRRLGRTSEHRKALGRNLVTALFHHGRIVTTQPKAKEYKAMAEKLITLGKQKTLHRIRQARAVLMDREALDRLFNEIGPSFADRPGGYTRIVKLPTPRLGDKASRVYFELVNYVPKPKAKPASEKGEKGGAKPERKAKVGAGAKAGGRKAKGGSAEADESEE